MKEDNFLLNIIIIIIVTILIFLSVIYFLQDDAIFVKQPISENRINSLRNDPSIKEINLTTNQEEKINGWFLNQINSSGTIIYFGGNAEEVSWILDRRTEFEGWNILTFSYRGYGLSEGTPTEKNLKKDSLLIFDYLSELNKNEEIIVKGRSIGTGIATYLAKEKNISGLILISPFDNLKSIVKETIPIPKITKLIKYDFNLINDSKDVNIPLLAIIADEDNVIPNHLSMKFYDSWEGKKEIKVIEGFGHNDMQFDAEYWESISSFLESFE